MSKLSKSTVFLAKSNKRGTSNREGYRDESGQVFLPPVSTKRVEFWKKQMEQKGYTFEA